MPKTSRFNRGWLPWVAFPAAGLLLGMLVALFVIGGVPDRYRSTVVVEASGSRSWQNFQVPEDPVGTLLSADTFDLLVKRLDRDHRWAGDVADVGTDLRSVVEGDYSRSTKELEIRVTHAQEKTSRLVAGALVEAYRESRLQEERARAERNQWELEVSIREQEELVAGKRKLFRTIVRAIGIPYIEGADQAAVMEEAVLRGAQLQRFEREKEKRELVIQTKTLLELKDEELIKYAAGLNLPKSGVAGLFEQFRAAEGNLAQLRAAGLGAEDLRVIEAQKNLDTLEVDLRDSVVVLQEILQTKLQLVDSQLEKLKEVVEERRSDAVDMALQSQDYVEAKEEYEQAKAVLETLKLQARQRQFALFALTGPSRLTPLDLSMVTTQRVEADRTPGLICGSVIGLGAGLGLAGLLAVIGRRGGREGSDGA